MAQGEISKCSKCRRYCRLVTTFLFSHIGLCGLVVGYSLIGAFTFEALEAGYEQTKRQIMLKERENVVTGLWTLTTMSKVLSESNWTARATETLQEFEVTLVRAVRKEGYDGKDESPLQWTFSGALLYSIIVITTIEDLPLSDLRNVWFQHDGAPPHKVSSVQQYIRYTFQQQVIGYGGCVE
ncbi:hypothetical protein AVEN_124105-1 [Araneus ventricosus]|uniref:TWiK family of potassium channels protein 7 n=1 Tax=Araneus ventricosus TaxID=182803 RepID=A0A4Y2F276_ARAVE|nr:hypothetical protein AVEN_124105-1 [Araneus ventricosus]